MAAGGSSTSMLGASDEVFDLLCEICQSKGKEREAKHFCENCNSYICESCKTIHNRIPDLGLHKISSAIIQNDCGLCLKEGSKINADHFCKTCNFYICSVCMDAHGTFDALKHHIIVSGKSLLRRRNPSASDDVSNKFSQLSTSNMSKCPTDSSVKSNKQNESRKSTQKSSKPAESVDGARSSTTLSSTDMSTGLPTITSIQRQIKPLADMTVRTSNKESVGGARSSTAVLSTDTSVQRQAKPLADMTVRTSNKINIKLENDTDSPGITGCCFMAGGELVLCDYNNYKIKLLNRSLTLQDSLALHSAPWDVADLDGSNIAVTLPYEQQVQIIQVLPTVKISRTVSVGMECRGIAVAGGAGLFSRPWYIAVNQTGDRVFVSDRHTHAVTCLSSDGKLVWRYKDDTLKGPRGLYVDSHDNIIACNFGNNRVDIITAEGKQYKTPTLLSYRDGIEGPYSVTFRPDDQTLVVGCWGRDVIYVYKLS